VEKASIDTENHDPNTKQPTPHVVRVTVIQYCENLRGIRERVAQKYDEDCVVRDGPLVSQQLLHPAVQGASHVDIELIRAPEPFGDLPENECSVLRDLTLSISEAEFGQLLLERPEIVHVPLA
jgi:hypothetical protein